MRDIYIIIFICIMLLAFPGFGQLIHSEDFEYKGAFRLPDTSPFEYGWYWGGSAMTYYPEGDPEGVEDGYSGSLFGVGHDWNMYVSEVSIPLPIISESKNLNDLNTAVTLQDFQNVRGDLFQDNEGGNLFYEIIRVGMEYIPSRNGQGSGRLHFAWGQHFQEEWRDPSHMRCSIDLSDPQPEGGWYFGSYSNYVCNDYLFEIPEAWAGQIGDGKRIASGRFRDGLWSGMGPALFAYDPYQENSAPGDTIKNVIPLLLYGIQQQGGQHIITDNSMRMNNFKEADEWVGGAWLTSRSSSAVIVAGTRGVGACWYGLPDGSLWEEPYPDDPFGQRGWWCEGFKAQILFFDPADLIHVTDGSSHTWDPQPYDSLNIDKYLFSIVSSQQKYHLVSVSYDRSNNHLFVMERLVDNDKPLVHVWKISGETGVENSSRSINRFKLEQNHPNPFNPETTISFSLKKSSHVILKIYNVLGNNIETLTDKFYQAGEYELKFKGLKFSSGIYFYTIEAGDFKDIKKMILLE